MADVHLINPMRNPAGGSEGRTIGLFEMLSEVANVQIWTEEDPDPAFLGRVPIRKIGPPDRFPLGGNLVFVGTYFSIGGWVRASQPARTILVQNLEQPERIREVVASLRASGLPRPEFVYASEMIAESTPEFPGVVHASPIDLESFHPVAPVDRPFTVGRLSRDVPEKHNPGDPEVYRKLSEAGVQARIMGGTCLGLSISGVSLEPTNSTPAADFLQQLDCFFFRTDPRWVETFGRVVFEAMACGLPVVTQSTQGYSSRLTHGHDCLFVENDGEAIDAITTLRDDAGLRRKLGKNARQTVDQMYGAEFLANMLDFYAG